MNDTKVTIEWPDGKVDHVLVKGLELNVSCGRIGVCIKGDLKTNMEVTGLHNNLKECDCGKEKHGFTSHIKGCPKYE